MTKMSTSVVVLLLALWLNAVNAQTVTDVQVVGGDDRSGYIQVTVRRRGGSTATGPVCSTIDRATASYACSQKGFSSTIEWGTVNSIGSISQPTSTPVGSNLVCVRRRSGRRYISNGSNGRFQTTYTTTCTVRSTAGCSPGNAVAVVCGGLSTGGLIGIILGIVFGLLLLIFIPVTILTGILIYKGKKHRAARSELHVHPSKTSVDDPTFGHVDI